MYRLLCVLLLLSFGLQAAAVQVIRHVPPEERVDSRKQYFKDLLALALEKSRVRYGDYRLEQTSKPMYQARAFRSLDKQEIDVVWSMTSKQREQQSQAVYFPLMKGLLGFRVFIIHQHKRDTFRAVDSIAALSGLSAIQGHDWPDTKILRHNGLKVVTDSKYLAIFERMDVGRYDYFPRGILEAWQELKTTKHKHLIVDDQLLLVYPAPVYFFVKKGNDSLAERLEYGLKAADDDGSFDDLLFSHPAHREAFSHLNVAERTVFYLSNPLLSEQSEKTVKDYQLTVESLNKVEN